MLSVLTFDLATEAALKAALAALNPNTPLPSELNTLILKCDVALANAGLTALPDTRQVQDGRKAHTAVPTGISPVDRTAEESTGIRGTGGAGPGITSKRYSLLVILVRGSMAFPPHGRQLGEPMGVAGAWEMPRYQG